MILFFDRSVGVALPRALLTLKLPIPVEYHQQQFASDEPDDKWLPVVGKRLWTVIGHDSRYHLMPAELEALQRYKIGCFIFGEPRPRGGKRCVSSPRPMTGSLRQLLQRTLLAQGPLSTGWTEGAH